MSPPTPGFGLGFDLDALAALAWAQLWQVTAAALVLGPLARRLGRSRPRLAHALWMAVVVKALVPPVVGSPAGVFSRLTAAPTTAPATAATDPLEEILPAPAEAVGAPPMPPEAVAAPAPFPLPVPAPEAGPPRRPVAAALLACWSAGAGLGLALAAARLVAFRRRLARVGREADAPLKARLDALAGRLGLGRPVRLVVADGPLGPAAFGLLRPAVLVPSALVEGLDPDRLDLVLAHELVHVRRRDPAAGLPPILARALWWFHPLVAWACREAARERERCCDEEVVAGLGCPPARYARALVGVLELKRTLGPAAASPGMRPAEITARRLEHIMKHRNVHSRRARLLGRLVFAVAAALIVPGAAWNPAPRAEGPPAAQAPARSRAEPPSAAGSQVEREWDEAVRQTWGDLNNPRVFDSWSKQIAQAQLLTQKVAEAARAGQAAQPTSPAAAESPAEAARKAEAKTALQRARDRLEWATKMHEKGYVSKAQLGRERLLVQAAEDRLEASAVSIMKAEAEAILRQARDRLEWAGKMQEKGYVSKAQLERERKLVGEAEEQLEAATRAVGRPSAALRRAEAVAILQQAQERLLWSRKMREKGYVSEAQVESDRQLVSAAEERLEAAFRAAGAAENSAVTLRGIIRDRKDRKPIRGIRVSTDTDPGSFAATTDAEGRYELAGLPPRPRYIVTARSASSAPYLIHSRVVDSREESADLDLYRGIPFRVEVLDALSGKPVRGRLLYFPLSGNDPAKWGASDWTPAPGLISGALFNAGPDGDGAYGGGLLPGPGILCFAVEKGRWSWKKGEREPLLSFPNGTAGTVNEIWPHPDGESYAYVRMAEQGSKDAAKVMLNLSAYPAAIVVNPREGTTEVAHQIRIRPLDAPAREGAAAGPVPVGGVTLRGTVRDRATGKPLAGVRIREVKLGVLGPITDESGRFTLAGLPRGSGYHVAADPEGRPYLAQSRVVRLEGDEPPPSIDLELIPALPARDTPLKRVR